MCLLATSEFSHEAVKKHQDTVITALKVCFAPPHSLFLINNIVHIENIVFHTDFVLHRKDSYL